MTGDAGAGERAKFVSDTLWNYAALGVQAASGILLNLIIARAYGAATLGVFNQAYAVYVIASQFAAGGIHFSTLKHVAERPADAAERTRVVAAALLVTAALGAACAAALAFFARPIGALVDSPDVGRAVLIVAPGLLFFALNKVQLAVLNGLRHMRAFAVGQALRFLLMLAFVVVAAALGWPGWLLAATFTVAEGVLALVLAPLVAGTCVRGAARGLGPWMRTHVAFGLRGFLSGVLLEINTRVDVVMLGLFLGDAAVGIYSFASMLFEGAFGLFVVVRNNVNPLLVRMLHERDTDGIRAFVRRTQRYVYPGAAVAFSLALLLFPVGVRLVFADETFLASWPLLAILLAGLGLYAGYLPFSQILLQAGRPGTQTLLIALNVLTNVVLNAVLIPVWGPHGAAVATAASLVCAAGYLTAVVRRTLGFGLGFAWP